MDSLNDLSKLVCNHQYRIDELKKSLKSLQDPLPAKFQKAFNKERDAAVKHLEKQWYILQFYLDVQFEGVTAKAAPLDTSSLVNERLETGESLSDLLVPGLLRVLDNKELKLYFIKVDHIPILRHLDGLINTRRDQQIYVEVLAHQLDFLEKLRQQDGKNLVNLIVEAATNLVGTMPGISASIPDFLNSVVVTILKLLSKIRQWIIETGQPLSSWIVDGTRGVAESQIVASLAGFMAESVPLIWQQIGQNNPQAILFSLVTVVVAHLREKKSRIKLEDIDLQIPH